jgi:nucleoside-diphosphate-sugar epimerase
MAIVSYRREPGKARLLQLHSAAARNNGFHQGECPLVFDISKAEKELAYHPKVSIEEAVQRTIEWYREQGYL